MSPILLVGIAVAIAVVASFLIGRGDTRPKKKRHFLVGIKDSRKSPPLGVRVHAFWINGEPYRIVDQGHDAHPIRTCSCNDCSAWRARARLDVDDDWKSFPKDLPGDDLYGLKALDYPDRFRQEYVGTFPEDGFDRFNRLEGQDTLSPEDRRFLNWWLGVTK